MLKTLRNREIWIPKITFKNKKDVMAETNTPLIDEINEEQYIVRYPVKLALEYRKQETYVNGQFGMSHKIPVNVNMSMADIIINPDDKFKTILDKYLDEFQRWYKLPEIELSVEWVSVTVDRETAVVWNSYFKNLHNTGENNG